MERLRVRPQMGGHKSDSRPVGGRQTGPDEAGRPNWTSCCDWVRQGERCRERDGTGWVMRAATVMAVRRTTKAAVLPELTQSRSREKSGCWVLGAMAPSARGQKT